MKKLLLALAILLMPIQGDASDEAHSQWFCKAVGNIENSQVMLITKTWSDTLPNHYQLREEAFLKYVAQITKGRFRPSFQAKCRDYTDPKRAEKHRVQEMKTAKQYNFKITEVNWRWTPDGKQTTAE